MLDTRGAVQGRPESESEDCAAVMALVARLSLGAGSHADDSCGREGGGGTAGGGGSGRGVRGGGAGSGRRRPRVSSGAGGRLLCVCVDSTVEGGVVRGARRPARTRFGRVNCVER